MREKKFDKNTSLAIMKEIVKIQTDEISERRQRICDSLEKDRQQP